MESRTLALTLASHILLQVDVGLDSVGQIYGSGLHKLQSAYRRSMVRAEISWLAPHGERIELRALENFLRSLPLRPKLPLQRQPPLRV
jgi:hypothetical protein